MIGEFNKPQVAIGPERHPLFNKSHQVSQILYGSQQSNPSNCSHFVDELDRFKRNFADYHKQEREVNKQKLSRKLEKKLQEKQNFLNTIGINNEEVQTKKAFQQSVNLQLFDLGLKKNGMTSGMAVNPINHQYMNSYGGKQLQKHETDQYLSNLVRMHHLQAKSTCGYNLINGKENTGVEQMVGEDQQQFMHSRIQNYKEHYRLRVPEG